MIDFLINPMITAYRKEQSINGLKLDVLKSGLQKYIRRGMTEKAIFCAGDLFIFTEAEEEGERIVTNFKHRLMVILLEDVCNLAIVPLCFEEIKAMTEKNICRAVARMCASDKARICSHARAVFCAAPSVIDKYPYLKELYRSIDETPTDLAGWCARFLSSFQKREDVCIYYAFKIHYSEEKLTQAYKRRRKSSWYIFSKIGAPILYEELFLELQNLRESFLCWLVPLLHSLGYVPNGEEITLFQEYDFDANWNGPAIELDPFVFDKHTQVGRGCSREKFVNEGAIVFPEASFIVPEWKNVYESKQEDLLFEPKQEVLLEPKQEVLLEPKQEVLLEPKQEVLLETKEYEFIVRAQLVTRRTGQDVYFARDVHTGLIMVVKGPYADEETPRNALEFGCEKEKYGLPTLKYELKKMVADRWPEGTPLGLRNSISRTKPSWFLIVPSLLSTFKRKTRNSKLWPPTEVVDFEDRFHLKFDGLTQQEMTDYVLCLILRYKHGVGDMADRNFLHYEGRILSIDEEARKKEKVSFQGELKKKRCASIYKWIEANYEKELEGKIDMSAEAALELFK